MTNYQGKGAQRDYLLMRIQMAHISTQPHAGSSILRPFVTFGHRFVVWMERIAHANSRIDEIRHLQSLSDEELAERGITDREDIVYHVFADRIGI